MTPSPRNDPRYLYFFDDAEFARLDRIELEAACRLRRIFTTSWKPSEEHFAIPGTQLAAPRVCKAHT